MAPTQPMGGMILKKTLICTISESFHINFNFPVPLVLLNDPTLFSNFCDYLFFEEDLTLNLNKFGIPFTHIVGNPQLITPRSFSLHHWWGHSFLIACSYESNADCWLMNSGSPTMLYSRMICTKFG